MTRLSFLLALVLLAVPARADDPLGGDIRKSEPNSPDAQLRMFHVPDGFQVQLIAADPEINKPMNLAFDARGRLWVTETHLYPMPAKDAASRKDSIKVIELGPDGRASTITVFADNLDIPVGIYPIGDGSRVIAYDINNVCLYTDTDGDGKSDQRKVLYSGWGYERDTHGMASNFRRGFDGWLYGCHGFNNISDVKSADGDPPVHMQSGNTYRMRLDGSEIQMFTIGQINPFGMSMDPLGNIYTSDSHSKPIYQLLRGGRYEAFDRNTDDGLGLAPRMMEHLHGSTAIAGSCFYAADQFPEEFRGNVFVGNVVTGKINRDKLEHAGSTPRAIEQPDLLSCDDPWFRPVNTILGPDGALYVADFYNRIIAHYEVKLDNPGRDYLRGRIWRLSYKKPTVDKFDISKSDANELIAKLDDPNLLVRQLATDQLSDRVGKDATAPLRKLLAGDASTIQKIHAMWVLYRLNALHEATLAKLATDPDPALRVHATRAISESPHGRDLALKALSDRDPLVRRCAADALGQHPDVANVRALLDTLAHADPADTHLVYTLRMAVRNQLRPEGSYEKLKEVKLSDAEVLMLADMSAAIDTPEAATFLLDHINQLATDKAALTKYLAHAVRFATTPHVAPLAALMREKFADDIDLQLEMFQSVRQGLERRGGQPMPDEAKQWGEALATQVLKDSHDEIAWTNTSLNPDPATAAVTDPWDYEIRRCGDQKRVPLLSSLPGGEQAMAVLRSRPFSLPPKLTFYLAGHNGPPGAPEQSNNIVRLKLQSNNEVIAEKKPPRDDVARKVTWDLSAHAGQQAYLEVTDADPGTGYAWLAFGRFAPPVVPMPEVPVHALQRRLRSAAEFAGMLDLKNVAADIERAMLDRHNEIDTRAALAAALATLRADASVPAMKQIVADPQEPMKLRDRVATALGVMATPAAQQAIVQSFRLAPRELQTSLANALASNTASADALLTAVADGKAPPALLMDLGIHDRLAAAQVPDLDKRVKKLTQGVAAPKEQLEKLIADRRADYKSLQPPPPPQSGQAVFAKNCMVCHTIDGQGGVVGPQLAGLSKRGVDRVVEDVLDPNRNLDPAFRYSTLILKDGRLITGLQKRAEGETLVFADTTGKEVTVRKGDIQKRIESPASLMPANFAEIIKPEEFNALLAYLLSK